MRTGIRRETLKKVLGNPTGTMNDNTKTDLE
jgi:hypothetical protein